MRLAARGIETEDGLRIEPYAFDDSLIERAEAQGEALLRIYRPDGVWVVLGRGGRPARELSGENCREDGVRLFRRHGGGCAVVLDPGNVVVSVALPLAGLGETKRMFDRCTTWLIEGLDRAGVPEVRRAGISDLAIGGRKLAGSAFYRRKNLAYYSASLLVDPDLALIERYLQHPPREPEYRRGRAHRDFLTTLREAAGIHDAEGFVLRLRGTLDPAALRAG